MARGSMIITNTSFPALTFSRKRKHTDLGNRSASLNKKTRKQKTLGYRLASAFSAVRHAKIAEVVLKDAEFVLKESKR